MNSKGHPKTTKFRYTFGVEDPFLKSTAVHAPAFTSPSPHAVPGSLTLSSDLPLEAIHFPSTPQTPKKRNSPQLRHRKRRKQSMVDQIQKIPLNLSLCIDKNLDTRGTSLLSNLEQVLYAPDAHAHLFTQCSSTDASSHVRRVDSKIDYPSPFLSHESPATARIANSKLLFSLVHDPPQSTSSIPPSETDCLTSPHADIDFLADRIRSDMCAEPSRSLSQDMSCDLLRDWIAADILDPYLQ